jgi:hypothetical protein
MHQRKASRRLDVEVPNVIQKDKWMFESDVSSYIWRVTYLLVPIPIES